MPISNSWLNSGVSAILAGIQELELNASSGGGNARYRHTTGAKVTLKKGEASLIIPGTPEPVNREVTVRLVSGTKAILFWEGMEESELDFPELNQILPNYKDTADGGIRLDAVAVDSDVELMIVIRQQEPITYKLGDDAVTNVSISLWVDTMINYSQNISDSDTRYTINNLTTSDNGISGSKIFIINGFTPGETISFNIDAATAGYVGNRIEVQLIKPLDLIFSLFQACVNNNLPGFLQDFVDTGGGIWSLFKYGGKTSSASGGEITITPKFDAFAGRFIAQNIFSGYSDTCVITDYQPNTSDSKQGGTFTLGGF